ncbi:hypothetical protein HPB50_019393 [Hyalomma asiaticum]|uniref:Uncharacterized protein n=1 Tax=Hyalomma asiaticum TaxID=266040 RepID=A0ACB7SH29_HYAAI|nr:hypothetical protein HPB50_019393 [Hyalomma asiaticum]
MCGTTLPTAFELSRSREQNVRLRVSDLNTLRLTFGNVKCVAIDDISMMSFDQPDAVVERLTLVKQGHAKEFGTQDVILCGDLRQLPRVREISAFVSAKQQWFDGAQMLVAYLAPIYLAPLLLRGTTEGRCAYCMLIVFEFWVLNVIPAPMASTVPLVLLPLLGVMDPDNVARHYMNSSSRLPWRAPTCTAAWRSPFWAPAAPASRSSSRRSWRSLSAGTLLFENVLSTLIVMPVVECTIVEIENDALTTSRRRRMLRRASVMARLKNQPDPDQPNQRLPALMASAPQLVGSMAFPQISRRSSRSSRDTLWTPDSGQSSTYGKGVLGCRRRSSAITIDFAAKFEQESQKYLLIRRVLLLSVAYSATLGAVGSVFGNPASRVLRTVLEERYSYDRLTILSWIVICLPISAAGILACWVAVFVVFLKQYDCEEDDETKESIAKILEEKYRALGNFSKLEFFVMSCLLGLFIVLLLRSEFATPYALPDEFGLM